MEKPLAVRFNEDFDQQFAQRMYELRRILLTSEGRNEIVLLRESLYSLLKDDPFNSKLKALIKTANSKVSRGDK